MAEWWWRQAHASESIENDPRTLAEVLRCLICELSYNPDSDDSVGRETLLNRYSQLMISRLSAEGAKDIGDLSQAAKHHDGAHWDSQLNFEEFGARLAPSSGEAESEPIEVPQLVRDGVAQFVRGRQDQLLPNIKSSADTENRPSLPSSSGFLVQAKMAAPPTAAASTQQVTTSLADKNFDGGAAGGSEVEDQRHGASSAQFSSFKTAREQLMLNHKKMAPANASGQSKKSLGTRRQTNRFTSPIVADAAQSVRSEASWSGECAVNGEEELPEELAHLDAATVKLIISEIMDSSANVSWSDIAGLQFAKKTLKEIIILPMLRPDIFTGLRGPPRGLLLFGPPGTGKTLIGKCVASQSKCTFFSISASSLTSKWVGEGEKMVRTLFAVARCKQPSVIFIDEIDSLLTQRSESEHESSRRIKTEFLVQMDGVTCGEEDRVLVIGATNRPQELDEAARRRFVKRLYIPLPESEARLAIVKGLMQRQSSQLSEGDLLIIVKQTEGYSGADMANLCREAALGPVRDIHYADLETITLDQVRPVVFSDFASALNQVRATVDSSDLHSYMSWNSKFGSWAIQHSQN